MKNRISYISFFLLVLLGSSSFGMLGRPPQLEDAALDADLTLFSTNVEAHGLVRPTPFVRRRNSSRPYFYPQGQAEYNFCDYISRSTGAEVVAYDTTTYSSLDGMFVDGTIGQHMWYFEPDGSFYTLPL